MLTLEKIIILRISDLKRFFNIEEFWHQKELFFDVVNRRGCDLFFDSEKEKDCYTLFYKWNIDKDHLQVEIKKDILYAKVGLKEKEFPLGRLASAFNSCSDTLPMKERIGITLLYLMLGAEGTKSDIKVNYDFLVSINSSEKGIPIKEFVLKYEDWNIPTTKEKMLLSRKIIANKSGHPITISSGLQSVILLPNECLVGLFTSEGCYRILPHHLSSPDGGLQLRLVCGDNCANLEIHRADKREIIEGVCSIYIEKGNLPIYLKNDGSLVYDKSCYRFDDNLCNYRENHSNDTIIAFEKIDGYFKFF